MLVSFHVDGGAAMACQEKARKDNRISGGLGNETAHKKRYSQQKYYYYILLFSIATIVLNDDEDVIMIMMIIILQYQRWLLVLVRRQDEHINCLCVVNKDIITNSMLVSTQNK